jgi:PKD repeat protein
MDSLNREEIFMLRIPSAVFAAAFILMSLSGGQGFSGEQTVTLQQGQEVYGQTYAGTADTHMYSYSSAADSNYGRYSTLTTGGTDTKRMLVKFKVFKSEGGPVPDYAIVSSATLKLYKTGSYDYGAYSVYQVLKNWSETGATWNSANSGDAWNTPGCNGAGTDRSTDPVASSQMGWDPGWMDVDVTACLQAFSGGTTNNGWLLVDPYGNYRTWASRDYTTDASLRPKLVITYSGNTEPVIQAYALPSKGIAPFTVTFDASASEDVDGTIISYSWDFGDGHTAEGELVEHLYENSGSFTATLIITDDEGGTDTKTFPVTGYDTNSAYGKNLQEGVDGYTGCIDAAMYSYHPDINYYPEEDFKCGEGDAWRPVVRFKTFTSEGGSIPVNAEILSATLCLYKTSPYSTNWKVWQLKKGFLENEVTWNNAALSEAWSSPGASGEADRGANPVATPWIGWDPGWMMVDVTSSLQSMASGTSNCGWLIEDDLGNIRWFASSENSDTTIRPKLLVTYRCPPTAVITTTPDPAKGLAPCAITFNGEDSVDTDGTILLHYWDFGDGEFGEGEVVSHTYQTPGCYKAILTITDDQGASASAFVYVGVAEEGSSTETVILQDGLDGYAGTEDTYLDEYSKDTVRGGATGVLYRAGKYHPLVKFKIFSSAGGPVNDGRRVKDAQLNLYKSSAYDSTCGAKRILKSWTESGATWNKFDGTTAWATAGAMGIGTDVAAGEEPMVAIGWDPQWAAFPVTADVEGFRAGDFSNNGWHIWRYWGNTNSKNFHSSEYATDTTLRPKLVLTISGNSAPVAKAEADVVYGSPPLAVQFSGTGVDVDGSIVSYKWYFGEGSESVLGQNPVHTYNEPGIYQVFLLVTDNSGASSVDLLTVRVDEPYDLTYQEGDGGQYSDTDDATIKSMYPTMVSASGIYLETNNTPGNIRKTLIRFPKIVGCAEGQIPDNVRVINAKLRLRPLGVSGQSVSVFRVLEPWRVLPTSPTWEQNLGKLASWSEVGCGYFGESSSRCDSPLAVQMLDGRPTPYEWDVTAAVQAWVDDAETNYGFVIESEGSAAFYSSDHPGFPEFRPMLLVTVSCLREANVPKVSITSVLDSNLRSVYVEGTKDADVKSVVLHVGQRTFPVTFVNSTRWFSFVERATGETSVDISAVAVNTAKEFGLVQDVLRFNPIDIESPVGVVMEAGNAVLLSYSGTGGNFAIDPRDGRELLTGVPGDIVELGYNQPGVYSADVIIDGVSVGSISVTVVSVDFGLRTVCQVGFRRAKSVIITPLSAREDLLFGGDFGKVDGIELLGVSQNETTVDGVSLFIEPLARGVPRIYVRLKEGGRLIGLHEVEEFEFTTTAGEYMTTDETYSDGSFRVVADSILRPRIDDLDVKLNIFSAGALFENGTVNMTLQTNSFSGTSFEAFGTYGIIMLPGAPSGPCHQLRVYEGAVKVGEY